MNQLTRIGVYGIALQQNAILLVSKGDQGCYRGKLDLPGGGVEFGESALETLKREFYEETGMSFQQMQLVDNLSHLFEYIDDESNELWAFHHLAQIYAVKGVELVEAHALTENPQWHDLPSLDLDQLTPFAKVMVQRLQEGVELSR